MGSRSWRCCLLLGQVGGVMRVSMELFGRKMQLLTQSSSVASSASCGLEMATAAAAAVATDADEALLR
jgi:hypothetical protein